MDPEIKTETTETPPKTIEEKKQEVSQKAAKIGPDEIKGVSESSAHALLEEVRALRADLSGGFFSKKPVDGKAPDAAKKPTEEKSFIDSMFSIFD